jgi:hypothetical protein
MAKKTLIEAFDEDFTKEIKNARTHAEAYDRAMQKFEDDHGFTPFPSYDSFRKAKERSRKKKVS